MPLCSGETVLEVSLLNSLPYYILENNSRNSLLFSKDLTDQQKFLK